MSSPGIDVDARHCSKQLPRRHRARAQDEHDLEGLCLRALGLGLTRLTGLACITWRLGLA